MKTLLLILILAAAAFACPTEFTVYGRVMANGRGVPNVTILVNRDGSHFTQVRSSAFGYYRVFVCVGTYEIEAVSKRHRFNSSVFTLPIADDESGVLQIDFFAK